eukprot:maker-scaffold_69-snap-gene-0.48-mRNA-1 protein AED:0.44 eAED:0.59 QI:0/0/0/1/0/0/2/0/75
MRDKTCTLNLTIETKEEIVIENNPTTLKKIEEQENRLQDLDKVLSRITHHQQSETKDKLEKENLKKEIFRPLRKR